MAKQLNTSVVLNSLSTCSWSSQAYETDGHTRINTDNRTQCAVFKIPSVFHTSSDRPNAKEVTQQQLLLWVTRENTHQLGADTSEWIVPSILRRWLRPLSCSILIPPSLSRGASRQGLTGGANPNYGLACEARSPCTSLLTPQHLALPLHHRLMAY